jgi:hypothetical protein
LDTKFGKNSYVLEKKGIRKKKDDFLLFYEGFSLQERYRIRGISPLVRPVFLFS